LQVVRNGQTDASTSNVQELLYFNHTVYYETTASSWFSWNGSAWVSTTDPEQQTGTESPNGTMITSTTGSIVDASLVVWTLVTTPSSGLQVAKNGTPDTTTSQILELLYWSHVVYQKASMTNEANINPGWWFWNGNAWKAVNGDPSATVVTWNPSDKSAALTLSNNNLTATITTTGEQTVRSTLAYSTGKFFFELTASQMTVDSGFGLANAAFNLSATGQLAGDLNGIGYYQIALAQGVFLNGQTLSSGTATDSPGDVCSCAVDLTNKLIWFTSPAMRTQGGDTWNNSTNSDPATGVGGISFSAMNAGPYFVAFNDDLGASSYTVNFGATPFSIQVPTGFSAWSAGIAPGNVTASTPSFSDDFTTLSLYNTRNTAAGGTWEPGMWYATDGVQVGNATFCINPFNPATPVNTIYTVSNGILSLGLAVTPSAISAACNNLPTIGANIQTSQSFSQLYGYFEIRCADPGVSGTSFDFYLMNTVTWPPELDILEIFDGIFTHTVHFTSTTSTQWANWMSSDPTVSGANLTQMHQYGVDWESDFITFYFDRVQTFQIATPAGYDAAMFPILDMTAGTANDYVGQPDLSKFPLAMQIDYVKVWKVRPF
jgi:hypothetical protein